jgi:CheY-like chemotaxis protein
MIRQTDFSLALASRPAGWHPSTGAGISARKVWPVFFLWLLFGAAVCAPVHAAVRYDTNNYEAPPLKIGSIAWTENQRIAKENQERYRPRVAIPEAVGDNVPRAAGFFAGDGRIITAPPPAPAPSGAFGAFLQFLFFAGISGLVGLLLLHRFAPQLFDQLNQRFNPWFTEPLPELIFTEKVRAEDAGFADFVAKFQALAPGSASFGTVRTEIQVKEFYAQTAVLLSHQRTLLSVILRELDELARQKQLTELRGLMTELKALADFPDVLPLWQTASAVEGLLQQLTERIRDVTPSTLRTIVGGIGLLDDLCATALQPHLLTGRPLKFLVVDDDLLSRHALALALKRAFSQPDVAVDGEAALAHVGQQAYDAIFLDVQMPGMDGFELCAKIRENPLNRATPVIFVTGHDDFDARAKSTISGGNDLMSKPFLTFEITVKALTLALQARLQAHAQKTGRSWTVPDPLLASPAPAAASSDTPVTVVLPPATPATREMERLTNAFLARTSKQIGPLLEFCGKIQQAAEAGERQTLLADVFLRINSLVSQADCEVFHPAYKMCIALEGLCRKLLESSKYSTPSTLATLKAALGALDDLCAPGLNADLATNPPIELLVVDDDLVARRVIVGALQTAFHRPESVETGEAALALAAAQPFDVIFMDVIMPGMDGFEACAKIRKTTANRATPVVFVTSKNDPDTLAEMSRSGGSDLLGKPFLTAEITLKALTFALRRRLYQRKSQPGQG